MAIRVAVLVRSRQFERNRDAGAASGVSAVTPTAANPYYFGDPARTFLMTNVDGTADSFTDLDRQSEQLALLPLPRLRTRHSLAQHALGELGMKSRCPRRPGVTRRERGVVLFVALIVLIVMTLAGLALLRQMGVGTSIAGNVAFKENATSVADRGTEAARAWLIANSAISASDSVANGYLSSWGAGVDPTALDWDNQSLTLVDDQAQTGNTTRIIIQRLCATAEHERNRPGPALLRLSDPRRRRQQGGRRLSLGAAGNRSKPVLSRHDSRRRSPQHGQLHPGADAVNAGPRPNERSS